jgi:excisionase family DNA binding protein
MQAVIPVGVDYAQLIEDVRAVVRHELNNHTSAAAAAAVPTLSEELLTVREAAQVLDVTVQTVHDWKRRGMLKYHKLGSRTYIKKADVLVALNGHQRSAKAGKGGKRG